MRRLFFLFLWTFLYLTPLQAQLPLQGQPSPPNGNLPGDPLGRTTPRSTLYRFIDAAQKGNYLLATRYLQLKAAHFHKDEKEGIELVRQLKFLIDRHWVGQLNSLSNEPSGRLDDGLVSEFELAGIIDVNGKRADLILIQVIDREVGRIWLVSAEALRQIPDLYDSVKLSDLEEHLPRVLVEKQILNMPLWQWIGFFLLYPIALGMAWLIVLLLRGVQWGVLAAISKVWRNVTIKRRLFYKPGPLVVLLMLFVHYRLLSALGIPLLYRQEYGKVVGIPIAIAFYWMLARMIDFLAGRLGRRFSKTQTAMAHSLLLLVRRAVKAILLLITILLILQSFGANVSAALAGIGIGGIALGLGAQKTLENLFGGISLLGDQAFQVGDVCKIADQFGTVEDIGLRSTSIRTVERTVVTIPNGALAMANLENFSRRDKILFRPVIGLRYETSADQFRFLLAEVRQLLYQHPRVETATARVRLLKFGQYSIDLEIFAYVQTSDYPVFLAVQEDLLLRIMDLVEKAGTSLAFPSQTLYLGKEKGLNAQRSQEAEAEVERWRKQRELPFPDHDMSTIAKMENTLEYPPPDSVLHKHK